MGRVASLTGNTRQQEVYCGDLKREWSVKYLV